jgi:hypothetical protein
LASETRVASAERRLLSRDCDWLALEGLKLLPSELLPKKEEVPMVE